MIDRIAEWAKRLSFDPTSLRGAGTLAVTIICAWFLLHFTGAFGAVSLLRNGNGKINHSTRQTNKANGVTPSASITTSEIKEVALHDYEEAVKEAQSKEFREIVKRSAENYDPALLKDMVYVYVNGARCKESTTGVYICEFKFLMVAHSTPADEHIYYTVTFTSPTCFTGDDWEASKRNIIYFAVSFKGCITPTSVKEATQANERRSEERFAE